MPDNAQYVDNELDRRIKQFDSSWRRGDIPSIADQLARDESRHLDAAQRRELLRELVMIDLEYRWRYAAKHVTCNRGGAKLAEGAQRQIPEQPRLEDYLAAYPELGPLERLSTELIASEYRTRHRWGDRPTHREYVQRFPHREAAVGRALERVDARLPRSSKLDGLRIRCPHCHDSIDVDDRDLGGNFTCPLCNGQFSLVDDDSGIAQSREVQRVGSIELLQRLGSGSFGTVWKSRDTRLDRMVAVKLPHQGSFDATQREQFMREARAAAQLNHPNIIPVHEVGREGDRLYIVTDLVQGVNLADWLTERRPTPREAAELCIKLADALEHAHQQGVIHRDVKPSNIMLDTDGEPHLMDFGLAKREAGEVTMTVEGKLLGTPAYMPPEQARGSAHEADCRSDIYSLGVILFELLTGERPFGGSTEVLLQRIILEDATSPRRLSHAIPQDLDTICLKCLDKDRNRRYQTATELREELQRFLHGEPVHARPITKAARTWRWCKRNPMIATLGATVASLLLLLAVAGPLVALSQARLATREVAARKDIRRQLYAADMNVALHAWEAANLGRVRALLAQYRPSTGQEDLRRFEWYYLWRAAHGHLMSFDHEASIYSAAFSRDGKKLYTGGFEATIKVWNVNTGKLLDTLDGHSSTVTSLVFSPDGATLVSSSFDGTIRLWQGEPLKEIDMLGGDDDDVTALALSPDGGTLAAGHQSGKIVLWDVSSRQRIDSQNEHTEFVWSVDFSPNGKILASCAVNDHMVKLWNIETGEWTRLEGQHTGMVSSVAFSPVSTLLASGGRDGRVVLWDFASGEHEETLPGPESGVKSLAFSSDGKMLASGGIAGDASAKIWDLSTYNEKMTLKGHSVGIFAVLFSPTNDTLVTASYDGTAKLWDVSSQGERNILTGHRHFVRDLAFSPNSETLVSGSDDGTVRIWDVESGEVLKALEGTGAEVWSVALSADGKTLASGDSEGKVTLWGFPAGNEPTTFEKHAAKVLDVAFSPSGRMMASCGKDDRVRLWDVKTGRDRHHPFRGLSGTREYGAVAFSPSGRILAFGGAQGKVQLWDVESGEEVGTLQGRSIGIRSVSFSPDGRLLAAASEDMNAAIVWNVSTGAVQQLFTGHSGLVDCVEFFADGKTLMSGGVDQSVRLWDMATGRQRFHFDHGEWVYSVAISPNGQVLASAGFHNEVKLWRAATEQEVQAAGEWWNR